MRLRSWEYMFLRHLVFVRGTTDNSVTLSQFQQINGFSSLCTKAYNTPIAACSSSDFTSNNPCSSNCVSGLQTITSIIDAACQGTAADPSTLIGLFFAGKGVAALCPNIAPAGTQQITLPVQISASRSTPAVASQLSTKSTTTPSSEASPSASSTTSSLPSSTDTSSVTTTSTSPSTTISFTTSSLPSSTSPTETFASISSSSLPPVISSASSIASGVVVSAVITSKAEKTASYNAGGGGSPFDIAPKGSSAGQISMPSLLGSVISSFLAILWMM